MRGRGAAWLAAGALLAAAAAGGLVLLDRRNEASCRPFLAAGTEVWLALGQSNAANHAASRYVAGPRVAVLDGGACLPARDPLPGGDGEGGSLWAPLAQAWTGSGGSRRVLLGVTAKGATAVAEWQPGGTLHDRALAAADGLRRRGFRVTRILWVQGEADAILGTSGEAYGKALTAALQPLHERTGAPVYIAAVSRCGDASSPAVRAAQNRVVAAHAWALAGPDLDRIGPEQRHERCHFAPDGQAEAVRLWLAALRGAGS